MAGRQSGKVLGKDRHHLDSHQNQGCAALLRPSKSADSFQNSPACSGLTAVHTQGALSSLQPQKPPGRQLRPGWDHGGGGWQKPALNCIFLPPTTMRHPLSLTLPMSKEAEKQSLLKCLVNAKPAWAAKLLPPVFSLSHSSHFLAHSFLVSL